jgi:surface polysaccharide O-acyltransferase-like enzyme
MAKKNPKRLIWADTVRILAIYFVILVHSLGASAKNILSFSPAIASTCVPLFIILSGALLLNKKENYTFFYKKRFLRLMLPWFTWTIIYCVINFFQSPTHNFTETLSLFSSTLTSFWFLPMIAALYLITPALRIFAEGAKLKDFALIIFLWFIGISVLPYYKNSLAFPFYVDDGIVRQVFTYLGYYLLGAVLMKVKLPKLRFLLIIFAFGITLSLINYYLRTAYHLLHPEFSFSYIFPGVILTSAAIFSIVKTLNKKLNSFSNPVKSLIISLSTASLGIYFIHGLITKWLLITTKSPYLFHVSFLGEWVNSIALFLISYLIILALTKIPLVKKFIT